MNNLRGIVLMILAMGAFAISDAFLKVLTASLPTGQVLIIFGTTGGAVLAAFYLARGASLYGPWFFRPVFLARLACDMLASACIITAFSTATLSLVSAIMQISPLVAAVCAAGLLKERLGPQRILAILAGLIGVLIIVEPWGEEIELGAIFAAMGASLLALRDVFTRMLPADTPPSAMVTYGYLAIAPGGLITMIANPTWTAIDSSLIGFFFGAMLTGIFGYAMITLASRAAEISAIAPFRYSRLLFALLIGGIAFGERLGFTASVGAAIVIGSGLFVFWREARLKRREAA
ncbi:MAG: DMT family transporter [Pseudomonadota bacterium]